MMRIFLAAWLSGLIFAATSAEAKMSRGIHLAWKDSHGEKKTRRRFLPPHAIVRRLTNQGYRRFRSLEFNGRRYVIRAQNQDGDIVRLVVDPRTGKLID